MDFFNQGFEQYAILVFGPLAAWLTQDPRSSWRRWACVFGLASQPFWFYACWKSGQMGGFVMSIIYTLAWMRGIFTHWLPSRCGPSGTVHLKPNGKPHVADL